MRARTGFGFTSLLFSLLIVAAPIIKLKTTFFASNQTPSFALPDNRRGIEFPAVRQQLHKIELSVDNVCEFVKLGETVPRLLVSTTVDHSNGGIQITLIENRLGIFSVDREIFNLPLSETVDNDCGINLVIENSVLIVSGKAPIKLLVAPKFSLLVVDEEMLNSGMFSAKLTTHVFGTQLGIFATLIRFAGFFSLFVFSVNHYPKRVKRCKTIEHA